jgi:hypothetical protein
LITLFTTIEQEYDLENDEEELEVDLNDDDDDDDQSFITHQKKTSC